MGLRTVGIQHADIDDTGETSGQYIELHSAVIGRFGNRHHVGIARSVRRVGEDKVIAFRVRGMELVMMIQLVASVRLEKACTSKIKSSSETRETVTFSLDSSRGTLFS